MYNKEQVRQELIEEFKPMFAPAVEAEVVSAEEEIKEPEITPEIKAEDEADVDVEKEQESNEESLLELDRQLSGHTREFKELVKSIKDPELQKKAIEAGKISRAREDRFASELGEVKKQYDMVANFKQMLDSDPKNTILKIAEMAKLDLKSLVEPTVDSEDDEYLLPEDRARNEKIKNIERQNLLLAKRLEAFEQSKVRDQQEIIDQEIDLFANNKEKYPHFEELSDTITQLLTIEKNRNGIPKNSQERISRLEKAYSKALLLDDNLLEKRDAALMLKLEAKRKAEIEKAKNFKKVGNTYASNSTRPATVKDELIAEFKKMGLQ